LTADRRPAHRSREIMAKQNGEFFNVLVPVNGTPADHHALKV
jgi:hypothetical protein